MDYDDDCLDVSEFGEEEMEYLERTWITRSDEDEDE